MEFKLFGRLRDDNGGDSDSSDLSGGSLDRTVENMFQQGYSEDEIREELEGQYSSAEISRAVNNAVTSTAADSDKPQPMTPYQEEDEAVSPMDEGYGQEDDSQTQDQDPFQQNGSIGQSSGLSSQGQRPQRQSGGDVDELVETVVAERLDRVKNEFESVYDQIDILADELESLEQRVDELETRRDEDNTEVVERVDQMSQQLESTQSRIGGLEKAFQQVLPSLVDNVKDLTSLVQEMKGKDVERDMNDMDDIDMDDWN